MPLFVYNEEPKLRRGAMERKVSSETTLAEDTLHVDPLATPPCPPLVSESAQLKFGVDRILSDEFPETRHPRDHRDCDAQAPCLRCVIATLQHCCIVSGCTDKEPSCYQHSHFYGGINPQAPVHTPKPVRPYTHLILESSCVEQDGGLLCGSKRKRSWSRAVFSNLQRKGLEKRFQLQKYITKPDRRQLAATLGLTDAQVKVWFQNRRMKWRHSKELKQSGDGPTNGGLNP